jgi:hypothetical protein
VVREVLWDLWSSGKTALRERGCDSSDPLVLEKTAVPEYVDLWEAQECGVQHVSEEVLVGVKVDLVEVGECLMEEEEVVSPLPLAEADSATSGLC